MEKIRQNYEQFKKEQYHSPYTDMLKEVILMEKNISNLKRKLIEYSQRELLK